MPIELPKNYDFKSREEYWRGFWEKEKIYQFKNCRSHKNSLESDKNKPKNNVNNLKNDKPIFSVDTPPPYVSASHLHAGHIMSYSQAEFIVRYKRMRGYQVYYPMGFDDNGLPTERFVEQKYKIDKSKISRSEFIKLCLKETQLGIQTYKNLWRLLGISVDWTKTYSTINDHCQRISQWSFIDLYKKGKVEQREGPIYWCPHCQTALAQADLEDKTEKGFLNYISFSVIARTPHPATFIKSAGCGGRGNPEQNDTTKITMNINVPHPNLPLRRRLNAIGALGGLRGRRETVIIATTRPELLGACVALYFNPNDKKYQHLKNKRAQVPLFNQEVPFMTDETVDPNFGTGLMMVCTWGDKEDIIKWQTDKLATRSLLDTTGHLTALAGSYQGLSIGQAKEMILQDLKSQGRLIKQEPIEHTFNVHERCSTPAEFIKTKQWFIKLLDAKKELLAQGKKLHWHPEHMFQKYADWVNNLQWDWCISRQRYYGVPFPIWYCDKCNEVILSDVKNLPVDPMEQEPPIKRCPKCGATKFKPETDVMDTWATSSMTPMIIRELVAPKAKFSPATLRPQAFEIIRTWLFYTLVKSFYHFKQIPFSEVMISGHGLDAQGRKISKRLGNYILPEKIIDQYGADALRYWATGAMLGENLRYNEEEIKMGHKTVTKIFNASKFCLMHLENFAPNEDTANLEPADNWALHYLGQTIAKATQYFEQYEYAKAKNVIADFFWRIFCDNYLEFVKYRLYGDDRKSVNAARQTLFVILLNIIKLYAPILPFITEEIYQLYFKDFIKTKSIHLASWPQAEKSWAQSEKFLTEFDKALNLIDNIRKYKSANNLSLGKELDEFKAADKIPAQYLDFVQKVTRVKKIK